MPDTGALLLAVVGAALGMAVLMLIVCLRGTVIDPARPPTHLARVRANLATRPRDPLFSLRMAGGLLLGVLVLVVTGWPVAALGLGGLIAFWPSVMGGVRDERLQITRLEALVIWCESLRDTAKAHASLEQAIPSTAENAAPPIRPALRRLTGQLAAKVPLDQALEDLAHELGHSADLIIAALLLNVKTRGDGLVEVLTNLAIAGREELDLRRKITASRAGDRRAVQLMLLIVMAVATFLVLFSENYTEPYRSVSGQAMLAVEMGLFATAFMWIRSLARAKPPVPFLPVPGQTIDPVERRIVTTLTGTDPGDAVAGSARQGRKAGAR